MLYGEELYGQYLYGDDSGGGEKKEDPKYYIDLLRYVPRFIQEMREFHEFLTSWGYEAGLIEHNVRDLETQLLVSTSTWGLVMWEAVYGIVSSDATYETRRADVLAKMAAAKTCTPALIETVAEHYTGVVTKVIEDYEHYHFTVFFIGKYGTVPNTLQLRRALEVIKPAHLGFDLKFRYVIWNELKPYTWDQLRKYTWDGLRVMEIRTQVTWHGLQNAGFTWKAMKRYRWKNVKNIEEAKE